VGLLFENHQEDMIASGPRGQAACAPETSVLEGRVLDQDQDDDRWFALALSLAEQAGRLGNVPVGAVLVTQGRVTGLGMNLRESCPDVSAHAEVMALREAGQRSGAWRHDDATLYVTVEPCLMCAGAIMQARVKRVVYGAVEPKTGAHQSRYRVFDGESTCIEQNLAWAAPCADVMSGFFEATRARRKRS
jgi:tRNA(adenine34) deaminase